MKKAGAPERASAHADVRAHDHVRCQLPARQPRLALRLPLPAKNVCDLSVSFAYILPIHLCYCQGVYS